jgi:GT2 family glycosyltransferase
LKGLSQSLSRLLKILKENDMKLRIIAVTYNHRTELEVFIGSLLLQTSPDWTCEIWHDGVAPQEVLDIMARYAHDDRIVLKCSPERYGKYGHPNRRRALNELVGDPKSDFVLHSNADNYYTMNFVEDTLLQVKERKNVGIVMCDCIHSHLRWEYHKSRLFEGGIDLGAAIVRLDIAKQVGFKFDHFSADGAYLEECGRVASRMGLCAVHIQKGLFVHN